MLVWKITEYDEARLDRYEGYPTFYYKDTMNVEVFSLLGDVSLGRVDATFTSCTRKETGNAIPALL